VFSAYRLKLPYLPFDQTLSKHESLGGALAMPQMTRLSATLLPPKTTTTPSGKRRPLERTVVFEGAPGPRELLENLVIQATAAKKGFLMMGRKKVEGFDDDGEMTEETKRMSEAERKELKEKMEAESARARDGLTEAERMEEKENTKMITFW
jgi:hypothetical protein